MDQVIVLIIGKLATEWQKIKNKWYYFNEKGHMLTGEQWISGYYDYFDKNGKLLE